MFSKKFIGEGNIGGAFLGYNAGQGSRNFGASVSFLQYFNLGLNYVIDKKKKGLSYPDTSLLVVRYCHQAIVWIEKLVFRNIIVYLQ